MIVCFVDIGRIDDHHCLNFLLIMIAYFILLLFFKGYIQENHLRELLTTMGDCLTHDEVML